jgi:ABC-type phosphate/phosphonate transport system ATPase subunit
MAGTGKSTILNTIASYCNLRKELGGSFCFKRNDDERTAKYMFSTIARGIAGINKDYKLKLYEAIETDVGLRTSGEAFSSYTIQLACFSHVNISVALRAIREVHLRTSQGTPIHQQNCHCD